MKIIKPDRTECVFRTLSQENGVHGLAFGLLHVFSLHPDGEANLTEPGALWSIAQKALGADALLDEGWPKERGEFLLYGSAHSDPSENAQPVSVVVTVGGQTKKLAVFGERNVNALGLISTPTSWSSMPITPSNAYGGNACGENPDGKGANAVETTATGASVWPLPNIEYPNALMVQRGDKPPPAGFWAWPASSPTRQASLGQFDKKWLEKRWPHLPLDTAADYFQTAPRDQQLASFFVGNEPISLLNLHPQFRHIQSQLPGLRSRIFFKQTEDFWEVKSRLETLWLFPKELCAVALFRAVGQVGLPDADDVTHVYASLEPLSAAPASPREHEQQFLVLSGQAPESDPIDAESVESVTSSTEETLIAVDLPAAPAGMGAPSDVVPDPDAVQKFLDDSEKEARLVQPELASAMQNLQKMLDQYGVTQEDIKKMLDKPIDPAPSFSELQTQLRDVGPKLLDFMDGLGLTDRDLIQHMTAHPEMKEYVDMFAQTPGGLKGVIAKLDGLFSEYVAEEKKIDERAQDVAREAEQEAQAAAEAVNAETPEDQDARLLVTDLRQLVITRHARKKDLKGVDLTGVDLSDLTLEGMDFSGATLADANFEKSRLQNCRFDEALLSQARFAYADVSGSSFQAASASEGIFLNCRLAKVNLTQADFSATDFTDAQLGESVLAFTDFSGAKMTGAQLAGCRGEFTGFAECDLSATNFSDANLRGVNFTNATLYKAELSRAFFKRGVFHGANFTDVTMRQSNMTDSQANERTSFMRVDMKEADLSGAVWSGVKLTEVTFNQAQLNRTDMTGAEIAQLKMIRAVAKGLVLDKATITDADLSAVNMFEGSLSKARISKSKLQLANFFGVDFSDTIIEGCDLEGSIIDRTILHARQREG
ncbi:MAG: DUF2169 domain-containing protein [Betaproteobacteria bacterium]